MKRTAAILLTIIIGTMTVLSFSNPIYPPLVTALEPYGYPLPGCFDVDPAIGGTDRNAHLVWAQKQTPDFLANNLSYKIALLFNCPTVDGDKLANAFADMSVIIANYAPNASCFANDHAVIGKDRAAHERWARTKTRDQVRDNLRWKAALAVKCMESRFQNDYFADMSIVVAKAPGTGGGNCGSDYRINGPATAGVNQAIDVVFSSPSDRDSRSWIGIYQPSAVPGRDSYNTWEYVGQLGQCSGTLRIRGVPAGQYVMYFFLDSGYTRIGARYNLTVR